jgi:RNA polymerase sigma factor (sigma-70 family)
MSSRFAPRSRSQSPYVVAMVLGTALSAFSPGQADAALAPEVSTQAVSDLGRYCTTCWRNARLPVDSWGDCTQEVFRRLLERVPPARWNTLLRGDGEERLEFLRAIDAVKKRTQRARKGSGAVDGLADRRDPHDRQLREDREAVRQASRDLLSPRQQAILRLSMEGWSVQEMATELNMPVERVSDEKYKAVRKLRARLGVGKPSRLPA